MRWVVTMSMVIVASACGTAPIGDLPQPEGTPLPDRAPGAGDSGTTTDNGSTNVAPKDFTLTVTLSGTGTGTIASAPAGVTCAGTTCTGTFASGTAVTLTPALAAGSIFGGWSGGCTGVGACAPVMNADVAVGAALETIDGAWSGTYTNDRPANGCNFKNAGNLTATLKSGSTISTTANITGLELRQIPGCNLVSTTTGAAPSSDVTIAGNKVTGTWTFTVQGANGTLAFPFTGTLSGKTLSGSWTCPSCTGSFTLTKP